MLSVFYTVIGKQILQERWRMQSGKKIASPPMARQMFRKMAGEHGNKMLVLLLGRIGRSGAAPSAQQWRCWGAKTARWVNHPIETMGSDTLCNCGWFVLLEKYQNQVGGAWSFVCNGWQRTVWNQSSPMQIVCKRMGAIGWALLIHM